MQHTMTSALCKQARIEMAHNLSVITQFRAIQFEIFQTVLSGCQHVRDHECSDPGPQTCRGVLCHSLMHMHVLRGRIVHEEKSHHQLWAWYAGAQPDHA